jgi:sulfofructose kinase
MGGGMAATAAVAIARLGGRAALLSRVGDDAAGRSVIAGLETEGVDCRGVRAVSGARTSSSAVLVDSTGERTIVNDRGEGLPADASWLPLARVGEAGAVLADMRWFDGARKLLQAARASGVVTVLDIDVDPSGLETLLPLSDFAIFSRHGLLALGAEIDPALQQACALGAGHAGVTLGAQGYVWCRQGEGMQRMPAFAVEVVDTTGAGDAFHGAFALAAAEGRQSAEAIRFASAVAAMKCRAAGGRAGLPRRAEVVEFLAAQDRMAGAAP